MRRCEYIERKTPSKNILEFYKHFSSRSHHKLFFGPPCSTYCHSVQCQTTKLKVGGNALAQKRRSSYLVQWYFISKEVQIKDWLSMGVRAKKLSSSRSYDLIHQVMFFFYITSHFEIANIFTQTKFCVWGGEEKRFWCE